MKVVCVIVALTQLDIENFHLSRPDTYTGIIAYMHSKAAMIMFGYTLAERLQGTGVVVNSLCPGKFMAVGT